jgi:hypothetical protein
MRQTRTGTILGAIAATLLLAGCGGSKAAPPRSTPTPRPVESSVDLTYDQMAILTLTLQDFGPRYSNFVLSPESGNLSLTGRSDQACQPLNEAGALSKYGWARGYERAYSPPDPKGADTLSVASFIDIYGSNDNAAAKLAYDVQSRREDTRVANGCYGVTIEGVDNIVVSGVGDQVIGTRERFSAFGIRGSISTVSWRRGKVVASVELWRMTSEDSTDELIALAKKLDQRLAPVVSAPLT